MVNSQHNYSQNPIPDQEDALKALADLELAPGASWTEVSAQHKRLVRFFHSDKVKRPEDKVFADRKLAKYNAARDLLKAYFEFYTQQEPPAMASEAQTEPREQTETQSQAPQAQTQTQAQSQSQSQSQAQTSQSTEITLNVWARLMNAGPPRWDKPLQQRSYTIKTRTLKDIRRERMIKTTALAASLLFVGFICAHRQAEAVKIVREPLAEQHKIDMTGEIAAARRAEQEAHEAREDARIKTMLLARQRGAAKNDLDKYERAVAQDKANISDLKARLATDYLANTSRRSLEIELNNRQNDLIAMQKSYDEALRQFQEIDGFRPEDQAYDEYNRLHGVTR